VKKIIAALLALALTPAFADPTYTDDMTWSVNGPEGYIRLGTKPCTDPAIVARIKPEFVKDFRAGIAVGLDAVVQVCYDAVDLKGFVTILTPTATLEVDMTLFTLDLGT
jgi:hypothetical protein